MSVPQYLITRCLTWRCRLLQPPVISELFRTRVTHNQGAKRRQRHPHVVRSQTHLLSRNDRQVAVVEQCQRRTTMTWLSSTCVIQDLHRLCTYLALTHGIRCADLSRLAGCQPRQNPAPYQHEPSSTGACFAIVRHAHDAALDSSLSSYRQTGQDQCVQNLSYQNQATP
jgi:hypothetical protein